MKLNDLKRTTAITFQGGDGSKAQIWVRHAGAEVSLKQVAEEEKLRQSLGLAKTDDLPLAALIEARLRARVGTLVTTWSGFDDNDGNQIPDRLADGSLNEDGGYAILSVNEALVAVDAEADRQRLAFDAAKKEAEKNFAGPSLVN